MGKIKIRFRLIKSIYLIGNYYFGGKEEENAYSYWWWGSWVWRNKTGRGGNMKPSSCRWWCQWAVVLANLIFPQNNLRVLTNTTTTTTIKIKLITHSGTLVIERAIVVHRLLLHSTRIIILCFS